MRVLFVQPDSKNDVINKAMHIYNFEPLGLYYLAATIKNYHDVELIDLINESILKDSNSKNKDPFLAMIRSFQPHIVAFSALTSVRTGRIKELCKLIKQIDRSIITIVGGLHASLYPLDFEDDEDIDILITKNELKSFPAAIQLIDKGENLENIRAYIQIENSSKDRKINLETWPKPYRELGRKYKGFYQIAIGKPGKEKIRQPIASVKTSSGCPFRCNFCCLWQLYPKYETRQINSIVEEISSIDEENIFFADDESLINPKYIEKLAEALICSGTKKNYIMYGRSDTICKNPALMDKLARAGLKEIWIGIEGSTDKQLNEYRKDNTTKSHIEALEILRNLGINIHATALVNHRFQKRDFDFMLKYTKETLKLTSCHFFVLTPFKGSVYHRKMMKENPKKFLTTNSDHFSIRQEVLRPEYMSIAEFHQLYADLQKAFNSDTISFYLNHPNCKQEFLDEFKKMKAKNELLYNAICQSHKSYSLKSEKCHS